MSQLLKVSMDDIGVPFGKNLNIEIASTKERYNVRVVGCLPNNTLIVSAPNIDGKSVLLRDTTIIKARYMMGTRVCAFVSKVIKMCREPGTYFHIAYPSEVESSVIRDKVRLETNLISIVKPLSHNKSIEAADSGILVDLSLGGAKLISKNDFGYENNVLSLVVKLVVAGLDQVINLKCQIKMHEIKAFKEVEDTLQYNSSLSKIKQDYLYVYSLEFEELSKSKVILLTAYILENGATPA